MAFSEANPNMPLRAFVIHSSIIRKLIQNIQLINVFMNFLILELTHNFEYLLISFFSKILEC